MFVISNDSEVCMSGSSYEVATAIFDRFAKSLQSESSAPVEPDVKPPREWIWADVPEEIQERLFQWQQLFLEAVPVADPVENLHITLFHELLNLPEDLRAIIATVANASPVRAMLAGLKAFRCGNDEVAIVVEVISHKLEELRHQLEGQIEHTPSMHVYSPHITIAYMPYVEGVQVEGMILHGIVGYEFDIDTLNVGTKESHHPCMMLSHADRVLTRHVPTRDSGYGFCPLCGAEGVSRERCMNGRTTCSNGHKYRGENIYLDDEMPPMFEKSRGMSTLTGESGGFLMKPAILPEDYSIDIQDDDEFDDDMDDDESDEDTEEEDDEQWIRRSQELADSLDDPFGDY
jgi:2'-5' RNA ligase